MLLTTMFVSCTNNENGKRSTFDTVIDIITNENGVLDEEVAKMMKK